MFICICPCGIEFITGPLVVLVTILEGNVCHYHITKFLYKCLWNPAFTETSRYH